MLLKTDRLTVRHVEENDWQEIRKIWVDFNGSAYAQYDRPFNTEEEDTRKRIARWAKANNGMEHMFFAVCLQKRVIGYVAFNIRDGGYEIGYSFHSDFHGKGYAKESILALIDHLRGLGITNISAGTAMENTPSVRLLRALGFRLVGEEKVSFHKDSAGKDIVFDGGIFELETGNA